MTAVLERTAPPTAAQGRLAKTVAAARYEYLMQVRRPAVWLVVLALITLRCASPFPPGFTSTTDHATLVADWAFNFIMLCPIGVGAVLADRARREARLELNDLLTSTPTSIGPRLWGKAIGAGAATITPVAVAWVGLLGYLTAQRGAGVIPVGLAAFAAIILPALLFVAAYSVTIPYLTGPALYRLGLFGYWIWGNMVGPRYGIPTPAGTPFEPIGEYPSGAWFHGVMFDAKQRGVHATGGEAVLSISFLLLAALAALAITHYVLSRRSPS
ncbi:hypothetical protein [Streptacidiphilus carbonis]|uniref:hypothetical protein n=1 Tax=Streptacidiphilus carbonis TaxID=105422 RepID=UPI0005A7B712|nr:hypothetical protein [Streptacidiphilus carbonis]